MTQPSAIDVFSIFADKVATKFKQMTKNNQPQYSKFIGSKPFSKTNKFLGQKNAIKWQ